jgi:hypothetical protein
LLPDSVLLLPMIVTLVCTAGRSAVSVMLLVKMMRSPFPGAGDRAAQLRIGADQEIRRVGRTRQQRSDYIVIFGSPVKTDEAVLRALSALSIALAVPDALRLQRRGEGGEVRQRMLCDDNVLIHES